MKSCTNVSKFCINHSKHSKDVDKHMKKKTAFLNLIPRLPIIIGTPPHPADCTWSHWVCALDVWTWMSAYIRTSRSYKNKAVVMWPLVFVDQSLSMWAWLMGLIIKLLMDKNNRLGSQCRTLQLLYAAFYNILSLTLTFYCILL